jgi:hypothetical protein
VEAVHPLKVVRLVLPASQASQEAWHHTCQAVLPPHLLLLLLLLLN